MIVPTPFDPGAPLTSQGLIGRVVYWDSVKPMFSFAVDMARSVCESVKVLRCGVVLDAAEHGGWVQVTLDRHLDVNCPSDDHGRTLMISYERYRLQP
jgi:hypothetical protein